jgi:hypothetical protein
VSLAGDIFPLWRTLWHPFLKVLLGTWCFDVRSEVELLLRTQRLRVTIA